MIMKVCMSKLISTQLYFNLSSMSTLLQLKFNFNSTSTQVQFQLYLNSASTQHQLNPNHKSISISASTQPQPKLNRNLQSNPGSSQPQLNFSLNISLNHNLNSIWLWHKSSPILFLQWSPFSFRCCWRKCSAIWKGIILS